VKLSGLSASVEMKLVHVMTKCVTVVTKSVISDNDLQQEKG